MVAGRALMAKLAPPTMLNEWFGLYAMSGTATSFVGPATIGVLTTVFQSQRAGVAGALLPGGRPPGDVQGEGRADESLTLEHGPATGR
jgi:UMF1 family MFS transporter